MENPAVKDHEEIDNPEAPEGAGDVEPNEGEDGAPDQESGDGSTGDGQEDAGEVEIIREGDTPPQSATPRGFLKRIGKLNKKVDVANEETDAERAKRLEAEQERDIYKARLAQVESQPAPQALQPPDPAKFDGGHLDADYIKAVEEYTDKKNEVKFAKWAQQASQQSNVTAAQKAEAQVLEKAQQEHFARAAKLKVKDYEETEDKAIEIFGTESINHLIKNLPNSEVAFYYFGKNPEVAQKYADMLKGPQAIKALLEIGGLLSEIKIKPKNEPPPDPDVELEGGGPSNLEAAQTKLNKLREAARTGKGMDKVLAFKKQCKAKGIDIR